MYRLVVGDGAVFTRVLRNGVGIGLACICQRVLDFAERDAAVLVVRHRFVHAVSAQGETELACLKLAILQRLRALENHRTLRFVGIHEVQLGVVIGGFDLQGAIAVVADIHRHGVGILGNSDALAVRAGFLHRVGVFAQVVQRVLDLREVDLAGGVVLDLSNQLVAFLDLEGEDIFRSQLTAVDGLGAREGDVASGCVGVGEVQRLVVIRTFHRRYAQGAVAVVGDGHLDGALGGGVGHTFQLVNIRRDDFLHGVGEFA